jgi:hypothetical protein
MLSFVVGVARRLTVVGWRIRGGGRERQSVRVEALRLALSAEIGAVMRLVRVLSDANVVSTLARVVALSGTAFAAGVPALITGSSVVSAAATRRRWWSEYTLVPSGMPDRV